MTTNSVKSTGVQAPAQVGGQKVNDAKAAILINAARKDMPFHEGPGNANPYTAAFGAGSHAPWCAGFVSTKLKEAGVTGIAGSASASGLARQFRAAGKYTDASKPPQPGDVIFFGRPEHHTGIVQKVENGKVYTIEGNSSDAISEHVYSVNDGRITGYGKTFGEGTVSNDLGFNVQASTARGGGSAPSNPSAASAAPNEATDTGLDGGVYSRLDYLFAFLEALLKGDTTALSAYAKQLFPDATPEQIDGAMNAIKSDPQLASMVVTNPEATLKALLADSSPAGIEALKKSPPKPIGSPADNAQMLKDLARSTQADPAAKKNFEQAIALASKPKATGWGPKVQSFQDR